MTYNPEKYGVLLANVLPIVIESDAEHDRVLTIIDGLMSKAELLPEEAKLLNLLVELVSVYEDKIYEPIEKGVPHEILRFLVEENDMKQKELLPIFGSEGIISEVLNGKRGITAKHARLLGEFFKVSPELFI